MFETRWRIAGCSSPIKPSNSGQGMPSAFATILYSRSGYVVVIYGDGPLLSARTIRRLIEKQRAAGTAATLISATLDNPRGYGRLLLDNDGMVVDIVEEKAATEEQRQIRLVNPGIYCFRSDLLWKHIDEIGTNNPAGEYYLTDMPAILRRAGHRVGTLYIEDTAELLAVNNRVELAEIDSVMRARKVRDLLLDGVTVERPETVTVDASVRVGIDSIIGPFAQLLGNTQIGENCTSWSVLDHSGQLYCGQCRDCAVHTDRSSRGLKPERSVGPFARLRMNNVVGESAHIGNFVELKNTRFGARCSASHLTYLGDSRDRRRNQYRRRDDYLQLRRHPQTRDADRGRRFRGKQLHAGRARLR